MRISNLCLSVLFSTILLVSCDNGDNNSLPNKPSENKCYKGELTVDQNDGTFYNQSDVEVDFEIKDDKLNFVMYKVKFASGMPIKLDMVVEGVSFEEYAYGCYTISGDGIIPYAMGGPFERFIITELIGEITPSNITLEFMCGEYPVTYNGTKK